MLSAIDKGVQSVQSVSSDVAHDLRTPLSRMRYTLDASLSDEEADVKSLKSVLKKTLQETDDLLETFSAILRISQLNAGQRTSKFQTFNVTELAQTFVEAYSPSAEEGGHEISFTPHSNSCHISGDKDMLGQLLSNLIENSLQHGAGPDHPALKILLSVTCDNGNTVLSVEDNGRGINAADQDKVFSKFYRGDYSRTDGGNGLGLALVKAVADIHDAKVELISLHPGVKFEFTFPHLS